MADLLARLGSRGTDPSDVRGPLDPVAYVDLVAPAPAGSGASRDVLLADVVARARGRRRIDPERLRALAVALASAPAAEVNHADLARRTGIAATTLPPYVELLAELGVVALVPGARSPVARRAIARPRVVWPDPAAPAVLAGLDRAHLLDLGGRRPLAALLRAAVGAELLAQSAAPVAAPNRVAHLRERNGLEVDWLLELPDDSVVGVEVRTAGAFRPHQFARLEALQARVGSRLRLGVVLLAAGRGHRYRPGLWTLPLSAAWGDEWPPSPDR